MHKDQEHDSCNLGSGTTVFGGKVINDLEQFNVMCDSIIANRYDACSYDVNEKVYTREIDKRKIYESISKLCE